MFEAIEATVIQVINGIAWGQWLSAAFLLLLGVVLGTLAARSVGSLLETRTTRHHQVMIRRLFFYLVFVLFAMAALREAGFSLEVVLGAAGILTVAIGFASQTSASNIISGLFLVIEKPFEIGDFIEVDATIGEVIAIDLLSVKLRTPDNLYVRIPNETLIKTRVVNRSRFPIRRIDLTIGIAYAEDVERVSQLFLELAGESAVCLEEPKPFVLVTGFGASSVDLQFSFWVPKDKFLEGRGGMMIAIKKTLDKQGIEIPFPHTSIYAGSHSEPFRVQLMGPEKQKDKDSSDVDRND
ncbi:mechanosensitive ion channel family protein [Marinobacter sp.]|uniref:mechanosensitive ion channel family protein n=1 Tax=Marinobacter sp. TaxID=50741 RepID=UPI0019FCAD8B|nr:mechanosensitive ion channel family protein [Marinobacter sp.]MBE0486939.1 mechanosensitive ion channel family protein [Marinobacter sp.]